MPGVRQDGIYGSGILSAVWRGGTYAAAGPASDTYTVSKEEAQDASAGDVGIDYADCACQGFLWFEK